MRYNSTLFVEELQKILSQPLSPEDHSYLDLSAAKEVSLDMLADVPPADPLTEAVGLILDSMNHGPFELTRLGINELLKSYLSRVSKENERSCTRSYLDCIYQLYLFALLERYPYTDLFWEYLSLCFDTVSRHLVEHKLLVSCQVFLSKVTLMGKWAAQKNLHTNLIQHFLHNMEIWAREEGYLELADSAKNHRFNLETV